MHERYAGLRERLLADGRAQIELDFDEFDVFLLGGLPLSAVRDGTWWTNSLERPGDLQVHAWLDAGYDIDWVDLDARRVCFRRRETAEPPGEPAPVQSTTVRLSGQGLRTRTIRCDGCGTSCDLPGDEFSPAIGDFVAQHRGCAPAASARGVTGKRGGTRRR